MMTILEQMPEVRGEIEAMVGMDRHTWFGVGGPAQVMFSPLDAADLAAFLAALPEEIPVCPLGAGSNLLVRDGGISGVVINMVRHINTVFCEGNDLIVGAGLHDAECARIAARNNIAGLEFLVGIPGTIGGGLRMNAGAYGVEFKDIVIQATAIDRSGTIHKATPEEMGMAYRHSDAPADWVFTSVRLHGEAGNEAAIRSRMKEIIGSRAGAQPTGMRTGGSTFANPDGGKAWQLIDAAGCRGLKVGAAMVSEKHCNFLINTGGATACDIETLGETVRKSVAESSGIDLRWEIRRVGTAEKDGGRHGEAE
jgi:UDP-N-acetylmuramate dehydrogenase